MPVQLAGAPGPPVSAAGILEKGLCPPDLLLVIKTCLRRGAAEFKSLRIVKWAASWKVARRLPEKACRSGQEFCSFQGSGQVSGWIMGEERTAFLNKSGSAAAVAAAIPPPMEWP